MPRTIHNFFKKNVKMWYQKSEKKCVYSRENYGKRLKGEDYTNIYKKIKKKTITDMINASSRRLEYPQRMRTQVCSSVVPYEIARCVIHSVLFKSTVSLEKCSGHDWLLHYIRISVGS